MGFVFQSEEKIDTVSEIGNVLLIIVVALSCGTPRIEGLRGVLKTTPLLSLAVIDSMAESFKQDASHKP